MDGTDTDSFSFVYKNNKDTCPIAEMEEDIKQWSGKLKGK